MLRDSVFDPILAPRYAKPTSRNAPLPTKPKTIEKELDGIDGPAAKKMAGIIAKQWRGIQERAFRAVANKDVQAISRLSWGAQPELQNVLMHEVWGKGYPSGGKHAIEEMKFAVPKKLRHGLKFSKHYGISDYLQNLINNLFTATAPLLAASTQLHQIMQRTFLIAGNYSRSILDQIKRDLLSSMIPPPGQTEPITRKELYERIRNTLNVSNARAENIARTETTNAYNAGRIETMQRSSLVTHWRFLAILDTRTTAICETRNGLVWPIEDSTNVPSLHYMCRSVSSPLMPAVNPAHQAMVADPNRNPANRTLAPLLPGWRTNV